MDLAIRKLGNSAGVILPATLLKSLGLSVGQNLEAEEVDGKLILTPRVKKEKGGYTQHLTIKNVYYQGLTYGVAMEDGSWHTHGRSETENEAKASAEMLAAKYGVSAMLRGATARQRSDAHKAVRQKRSTEGASVPLSELDFDPTVVAVPTMGGIIAELPLSRDAAARFPEEVCLPVTKLAAEKRRGWVVVEYEGRGVAMLESEAVARGLREAPNWIPDLTGARSVPAKGEIQRLLKARE